MFEEDVERRSKIKSKVRKTVLQQEGDMENSRKYCFVFNF